MKKVNILGVEFTSGDTNEIIDYIIKNGGLLTVPAAPALINLDKDTEYRESLLNSDVVICDSGYMTLIWNLLSKEKVKKLSGLKFIKQLLNYIKSTSEEFKDSIFLIEPNLENFESNRRLFSKFSISISENHVYLAPHYKNDFNDFGLLKRIIERKPKLIIINIGGGKQEKLGLFLKKNLVDGTIRTSIICTGAALSFLNGTQARIPMWADKMALGWFFRIIHNPRVFIPRYLVAFRLASYFWALKMKRQ